ncbi:hypothetical protein EON65_59415, partial [archaeon]
MNNFILFAGGVILGILLSLTIVQYDFHSSNAPSVHTSVDSSQLLNSLRKSSDKDISFSDLTKSLDHIALSKPLHVEDIARKQTEAKVALTPVRPSSPTTPSSNSLLTKDRAKIQDLNRQKESIRWAPGKEMSLDKFKQE